MKPKRRILSLLLAICLVVGIMPTAAFAANNDKAIQLGASNISGYDSTNGYDYIYYGEWDNSPIKWRVLDEQTNTQNEGLFLLSDVLLGTGTDGGVYFDNSGNNSNVWQKSTAQTWCKNFYSNNFSSKEQNAVLATTKSDSAYTTTSFGDAYGVSSLSGDKVFFLSAEEAENSAYGFTDDNARIANYGNRAGYWWLRSPYANTTSYAGLVYRRGGVHNVNVLLGWAARPAFNLNRNSVLFTSAAVGGKSSGAVGANALQSVSEYTGNEWKLTLLDESRSFTASVSAYDVSSRTVTATYSGASTGTNEYVSALIMDSSNSITYYGRLKSTANDGANGTVQVTLPEGFDSSTDTLYLFSEQYNGDKATDYASALQELSFTYSVTNNLTNITTSNMAVSVPIGGTSDYTATLTATGDYVLPDSITVTVGNSALTAGANTYTYNSATGELAIKAAAITGDIVIMAQATNTASIGAPDVAVQTGGSDYTSGSWTADDVTFTISGSSAPSGIAKYQYSINNGQRWTDMTISEGSATLTVSESSATADGTAYIFRAVSNSGGEGTASTAVTVKIDKTEPNGDITIEENSVKKFIHDVTFGLFFKENVEVAITGTDSGSGVQTIEYYRSAKVLTEEQVAALTDWTAYTSAISETAQDAEQFVYYVRITDNAGNTTCFASDGATFDLTKPMITGIADGADYYTTQSVQATDTNLDSVTLNGKKVGTEFTLAGNTETEYVIVAADKAGNETTVTITMHKTEALRENLGDITKDNATSADRETVQDYLDDLKERLKDEKLTDEEKAILEGLADEAQDILDRLDEAEQAGSTEAIDQTQDITSGNVTPEDKEALEQAKEDIEKALDEFGSNYTDEEKAELEEDLSRIEEALDVIERIEDTEAAIEALPDTVNPDDTKAEEQINAAKDLYDALSDYEKSLISADAKDKLEGLLAALCDYRITEGSGSTFTKSSSAGLTFTANGAYSKFTEIEVDGKAVDADGYTVENGRTVITLKAEYLETLAAGKHTLTVLYTDGEATGTFTVAEKPAEVVDDDTESPQTGDDSNIALWIAVLLASGAGISVTAVSRRKRRCKTK